MRDNTAFAEWLRRRRRSLDLTQAELAQQVNCSLVTIRKLEYADSFPSKHLAATLAQVLGIQSADQEAFVRFARGEQEKADKLAQRVPQWQGDKGQSKIPNPKSQIISPPHRAVRSPAHNLPEPAASLIGRNEELGQVEALLRNPACRLLTIVGPGGVGKTRLAIETAKRILDFRFWIWDSERSPSDDNPKSKIQNPKFPDGVFFVPLASVSAPAYIVPAIASAAGFTFYGQLDAQTQLFNYLREKQMLLVLDNLEHLLTTSAEVENDTPPAGLGIELLVELLQRAPGVKILATSRAQLNLPHEWLLDLKGLRTPPVLDSFALAEDAPAQAVDAAAYSALTLFLQTARRIKADFRWTDAEQAAVVRICQLVEGLPLGIELAASWVRALSCQEIADEIQRNLAFLTTSVRGVPERHCSLQAVFDHSWRLLAEEEQRVLRGLSVFRGGFTRSAAAAVVEATLPVLSALVAKSLVRHQEGNRYDLHELVRQCAAAQLALDPHEQAAVQQQHGEYYLTLVASREEVIYRSSQKEVLAELSTEIDNIRLAWDWALAQRRLDHVCACAFTLYYFLELRNYFQEGKETFHRARAMIQTQLAQAAAERASLEIALGNLGSYQGVFTFRLGRTEEAYALLTQTVTLLRRHTDHAALAAALFFCGIACWFSGKFAEAAACHRESLALSRELELQWFIPFNLFLLGIVLHELGDYREAYRLLNEGMASGRILGDPRAISAGMGFLCRTAQVLGCHGEMATLLREARQVAQDSGDRYGFGVATEHLALVSHTLGDATEGRRLLEECYQLYREIGDGWSLARVLNHIGNIALAQANYLEAKSHFLQALHTAKDANVPPPALDALMGLAALLAQTNMEAMALALAEVVRHHPAATQEAHERAGQLSAELATRLAAEEVVMARGRFQDKALDAVIAEALSPQASIALLCEPPNLQSPRRLF